MEIREKMPFDFCNECSEFILDVNDLTYYANDGIMERVIEVSCKNRALCRLLKANIESVIKGEG